MGAARVLLVESSRAKRSSFADALKRRYEVVTAPSGKQGLLTARETPPDIVVVDAISMRTKGDRVCASLHKALKDVPLIHLRPSPVPRGTASADAVLHPPFTSRKLVNSIERLLQPSGDAVVVCGPFSVHLGRRVLTVDGQETQLTPKLAHLVETFMRHPGQTLDRRYLMEKVWHTDYLGDTRTLDVHIRWIRRAIETNPGKPQYLKTIRGVGYRLEIPEQTPVSATLEPPVAVGQ